MAGQAANNALAQISGHLHPGKWEKTERAEENLRSFNKWYESYKRWTNICLRGIQMDDSMRWDMLIATAGDHLHDIIKEASIETETVEAQDEIPYAAAQDPVPPDENGEGGRDGVPVQHHVPRREGVTPHTMDEGLVKIRDTITKHSNPIMQRSILMTKTPPSDYDDWRTWGLALKEQAQRCGYGPSYTWEVAALDALLFQCPDPMWKKKILAGKMNFQAALDYGIREITAKKISTDIGKKGNTSERTEESVNKVETNKGPLCKKCVTRHPADKCPAKGIKCSACGQNGHYSHAYMCPNNPNHHLSQRWRTRQQTQQRTRQRTQWTSHTRSRQPSRRRYLGHEDQGHLQEGGQPVGPQETDTDRELPR